MGLTLTIATTINDGRVVINLFQKCHITRCDPFGSLRKASALAQKEGHLARLAPPGMAQAPASEPAEHAVLLRTLELDGLGAIDRAVRPVRVHRRA